MTCPVCRNGETANGMTTVTLDRNAAIVLIRDVPAEVCSNCGEAYLNGDVAAVVYELGERANTKAGQVQVRSYPSSPALVHASR